MSNTTRITTISELLAPPTKVPVKKPVPIEIKYYLSTRLAIEYPSVYLENCGSVVLVAREHFLIDNQMLDLIMVSTSVGTVNPLFYLGHWNDGVI